MGERLRLKKNFDISGFSPAAQAILKGLKKYGVFVADNGLDWTLSVVPDSRIPLLHEEFSRIKGSAFEVVERYSWSMNESRHPNRKRETKWRTRARSWRFRSSSFFRLSRYAPRDRASRGSGAADDAVSRV